MVTSMEIRSIRAALVGSCALASWVACGDTASGPIDCPSGAWPYEEVQASGELERWCETSDGVVHGPYVRLAADGAPRVEGRFAGGQADGRWRWYGDLEPVVVREGHYRAGLPHGVFTTWFGAGLRESEREFAAGIPCGTWRDWDADGALVDERELMDCALVPAPEAPDPDLVAPRGDTGWDGAACPEGAVVTVDPLDPGASLGCRDGAGALDGPYGRWHDVVRTRKAVDGAYDQGLESGRWRGWDEDGNLRWDTTWERGVRSGPHREYRPDGSLAERGAFVDDLRDGTWEGFHDNGTPAWEGSYQDGLEQGAWWWRDARGFLVERATFVAGVRAGAAVEYHPDGEQACAGDYAHHYKDGPWTCWHDNGEVAAEQSWERGQAHGLWETFDREGRPLSSGGYERGHAAGAWSIWEEITYFGGSPWRTRRSGQIVDGRPQGRWTGTWELPGDPKEAELDYRDGLREGPWLQWWPSGANAVVGEFLQGMPQGRWRLYYESGQLHIEEGFMQGLLDGEYVERWEDGDLKVKGLYRLGVRVEIWHSWDADGNETTVDCGNGAGCP
ncbi:MAG: hypothetical protein IT385_04980 [Deltaproteobacteria bacterium]|nr:hypothetical protein [Deltaproteobacteria bacterium]